ncbi:hypothetical protein [Kitasatospora sp. CB01950]|uniref:hypothetical protein n=1 Tax=Kitasatospora sp. CB01950 TaxID=1703930 RepID=UPI00093F2CB2|nr:hypothetical protein [Kitasatospora sp. CB01950]OKJ16124.1 hypothetical protein AMK19_08190 [Kitasatospora sp. CB01950]
MFRTGRTLLAATAVVLALTATACGSKGADGSAAGTGKAADSKSSGADAAKELTPAAMLAMVGEKTSAAKSAKTEATMQIGATKASSMKGAISWEHGLNGELTGTMGGPMAETLSKAGGDGTFTARYLDDAMYVNMGAAMAGQLGGAHWIKYGYADLAKLMGAAGDSMKNQLQNADPVSSVRALIASGKVDKAGTESVNGVQATKYAGDLSAADITQATTKGLTQAQADALQKQFAAAGITSDHIEVWVTADNLLVKKVEQMQSKAGEITSTATYSDYGTAVSTTPPSASDTVDFTKFVPNAKS